GRRGPAARSRRRPRRESVASDRFVLVGRFHPFVLQDLERLSGLLARHPEVDGGDLSCGISQDGADRFLPEVDRDPGRLEDRLPAIRLSQAGGGHQLDARIRFIRWAHVASSIRNNASRYCPGSNRLRSSRPSPMPTSLTGTESSASILSTTPARALPSIFVTASPVKPIASWKTLTCCAEFCPTCASSTASTSCGASGSSRCSTRRTLRSSSTRSLRVCSRPAVSMIT